MITPEKIEEWIKEIHQRPESASLIIQYIANRLRELTKQNEALLEENIALQSGKRVEEFERQIAHLEYQLDLLKRQAGSQMEVGETSIIKSAPSESLSILIYDAFGRVFRIVADLNSLENGRVFGRLQGEFLSAGEPPRLMVVPLTEELLFVFSSGRVAPFPVANIATTLAIKSSDTLMGSIIKNDQASIPIETRPGETLACLAVISKLTFAEYFIQTSRRGYVKKIRTTMGQSILAQHYIGIGAVEKADKVFDVVLSDGEAYLTLVSHEGYLLCLDVKDLPFAIEEAMRIGTRDHIVATLVSRAGQSILGITQIGKVVHWTSDRLEVTSSLKRRGQTMLSQRRRDTGVRFVGAVAISEEDWGISLDREGWLTLHCMAETLNSGTISTNNELLAFSSFSTSIVKK